MKGPRSLLACFADFLLEVYGHPAGQACACGDPAVLAENGVPRCAECWAEVAMGIVPTAAHVTSRTAYRVHGNDRGRQGYGYLVSRDEDKVPE